MYKKGEKQMGFLDRLGKSLESVKIFLGKMGSKVKDILSSLRKSKLVGVAIDSEGKLHAVLSPNGVSIAVSSDESFTFQSAGFKFKFDKAEGTFSVTGNIK